LAQRLNLLRARSLQEPEFGIVRRVLGPHGQHVKRVAQATGARLRLRGRESQYLEGVEQVESTDPLMLCASAPSGTYGEAVRQVRELLEQVYAQYRIFCAQKQWPASQVEVRMHEGAREGAL